MTIYAQFYTKDNEKQTNTLTPERASLASVINNESYLHMVFECLKIMTEKNNNPDNPITYSGFRLYKDNTDFNNKLLGFWFNNPLGHE